MVFYALMGILTCWSARSSISVSIFLSYLFVYFYFFVLPSFLLIFLDPSHFSIYLFLSLLHLYSFLSLYILSVSLFLSFSLPSPPFSLSLFPILSLLAASIYISHLFTLSSFSLSLFPYRLYTFSLPPFLCLSFTVSFLYFHPSPLLLFALPAFLLSSLYLYLSDASHSLTPFLLYSYPFPLSFLSLFLPFLPLAVRPSLSHCLFLCPPFLLNFRYSVFSFRLFPFLFSLSSLAVPSSLSHCLSFCSLLLHSHLSPFSFLSLYPFYLTVSPLCSPLLLHSPHSLPFHSVSFPFPPSRQYPSGASVRVHYTLALPVFAIACKWHRFNQAGRRDEEHRVRPG